MRIRVLRTSFEDSSTNNRRRLSGRGLGLPGPTTRGQYRQSVLLFGRLVMVVGRYNKRDY